MGASRPRLLRQLLVESLTLSLVGGVVGMVGAVWAVRGINAVLPPNLLPIPDVSVDAVVLLFAFGDHGADGRALRHRAGVARGEGRSECDVEAGRAVHAEGRVHAFATARGGGARARDDAARRRRSAGADAVRAAAGQARFPPCGSADVSAVAAVRQVRRRERTGVLPGAAGVAADRSGRSGGRCLQRHSVRRGQLHDHAGGDRRANRSCRRTRPFPPTGGSSVPDSSVR